MIKAYIDFKSLECFLAIDPVIALAGEFGFTIDWTPFSSHPRALPTKVANESVTQTHHRVRAASEHRLRHHYATVRGFDVKDISATQDSTKALIRLNQIPGDRTEFVKQAFEACWLRDLDLNNSELLDEICANSSVKHDSTKVDFSKTQTLAEEAGLFDAPTFVINGQLFMGRAHIPWMRQLLTDIAQQ